MKLDRALIKSQAKQIIKGQVFGLFLVAAVIGLLTGGINYTFSIFSNNTIFNEIYDEIKGIDDSDYFDDFEDDGEIDNDFNHFNFFNGSVHLMSMPKFSNHYITGIQSRFGGLISFLLAPLSVTLVGLYVMIIRGNKMKTGDYFKYVFSNTFNETYLKKFVLYLLKTIITALMFCLFIIPGIIFHYRYFFAEMILNDNPNMSAKDALKLSAEMTKGHKGELFALDISFIGWALLVPLTLGLITIYTLPYFSTVQALYYENFRMRCIEENTNPEQKFMTEQEKGALFEEEFANKVRELQAEEERKAEEQKNTFGSGMDNNYYNGNF